VVEYAKAGGFRPMGMEGERDSEWVLVDLNDVIVHVMLPRVREFYGLEELWEPPPALVKARSRATASAKRPAKSPAKKAPGRKSPARKAPARKPAKKASAPRGRKPARGSSRARG